MVKQRSFIMFIDHFQGCELEAIFTECGLNGGVGGPDNNFGLFHFESPPVCNK